MSESPMQMDQDSSFRHFQLTTKRPIPTLVRKAEWHPDKDLLAMVMEDGKIVLHRLNWDRLWTITPEKKVTSLCWRPDGKALAVGLEDGTISLHDVENGNVLRSNKSHGAAVVSLSWVEEGQLDLGDTYDIFSYEDRTSRFFPPPKAPSLPGLAFGVLGSMENQNGTDQEVMNSSQQRLNILCSGDEQGVICFSVFGVFSIGKINIGELSIIRSQESRVSYQLCGASLFKVALSKDLGELIVLCYGTLTTGMEDSRLGLYCLRINTSIFQKRHKELHQVALQVSNIKELLDIVCASLKVMQKKWSDSINLFQEKFHRLSSLLLDHGLDSSPQDELVNLLCGDPPNDAMHQFLENSLGELELRSLAKSIDSAGKELHGIIGEHLQPAAEIIAFRVGELKGLSRWHSRLQNIGLEEKLIDQAMEDAGMLVIQIERLLRILSETLYQFQNFFSWLMKLLKQISNEAPSQADQLPVINSELVMVFLKTIYNQDPIVLHLEDLQEDVTLKLDPEASSRLEELVAFGGFANPNFLQRTLRQQFDHLRSSCTEAFHMPFVVISQKMFCEDIMLLSYVPNMPKTIDFREPISVAYYEKVGKGLSEDPKSKHFIEDYICFRMLNQNTSDNSGVIVLVRGFTRAGKSQHTEAMDSEIEVVVLCFEKGFHCTDLALYKEDEIVLLLNEKSSTNVSTGQSWLMLLPTSDLPFAPLSVASEDIPLFDLYHIESNDINLSLQDGRVRRIPYPVVTPLAVSVSRSLACIFTSQRYAIIYELEGEDDEEDDQEEDKDAQ